MAAFGASDMARSTGSVTSLDTGDINVTGSDLALVTCIGNTDNDDPTTAILWDPAGNNESMTGDVATVEPSTYCDARMAYLDDPTAANAPVRGTFSPSTGTVMVGAAFFTAAGDINTGDSATDSLAGNGSSLSATVPNVVTNDMVVDFVLQAANNAITFGADQTAREEGGITYMRSGISTQEGADGGVMSCTWTSHGYGSALIALRIPNAAAGGGDPEHKFLTLIGVG